MKIRSRKSNPASEARVNSLLTTCFYNGLQSQSFTLSGAAIKAYAFMDGCCNLLVAQGDLADWVVDVKLNTNSVNVTYKLPHDSSLHHTTLK